MGYGRVLFVTAALTHFTLGSIFIHAKIRKKCECNKTKIFTNTKTCDNNIERAMTLVKSCLFLELHVTRICPFVVRGLGIFVYEGSSVTTGIY